MSWEVLLTWTAKLVVMWLNFQALPWKTYLHKVSHFSYASFFQSHIFDKNAEIEHFLWFFSISSSRWCQWVKFHKKCSVSAFLSSIMRLIMLRQRQFWQKCTCNLNVYIFYLCLAPDIIHGDRYDRKTPKAIILFKLKPFFGRWIQ